jgi:hypothetical protein
VVGISLAASEADHKGAAGAIAARYRKAFILACMKRQKKANIVYRQGTRIVW